MPSRSFDDSDIVQIFSEIKEQELKDMMKLILSKLDTNS
jgi:hypothetical protein